MPRIAYKEKKMRQDALTKIEQANAIIADYQDQGFDLTLRQLYYQFVSRNYISNNEREYKNLGNVIADGRLAGLIDWDAIIDRTRFVRDQPHWQSPESIVSACANQFRLAKWDDQDEYVEVWIEKDALIGVIEGVCQENDVPYLACRGYASMSEIWTAGYRRIKPRIESGKKVTIIYLGDNPPPNPTKLTDTRSTGYIDQYGEECWELDALDPTVIRELIQAEIDNHRSDDVWARSVKRENKAKKDLSGVAAKWAKVIKSLPKL